MPGTSKAEREHQRSDLSGEALLPVGSLRGREAMIGISSEMPTPGVRQCRDRATNGCEKRCDGRWK